MRCIFWNFQTVLNLSGKGQSSVLGHRAHGEVRGVLREGCISAVPESMSHRRLPLTRSSIVDSARRESEEILFQVRKKYLCLSPRQRRKSEQGGSLTSMEQKGKALTWLPRNNGELSGSVLHTSVEHLWSCLNRSPPIRLYGSANSTDQESETFK